MIHEQTKRSSWTTEANISPVGGFLIILSPLLPNVYIMLAISEIEKSHNELIIPKVDQDIVF
jgi:hypothetical protein